MTLREIVDNLRAGHPVSDEDIIRELGKYEQVVFRYGGGWVKTFFTLLQRSDPRNLRDALKCLEDRLFEYEKFLN